MKKNIRIDIFILVSFMCLFGFISIFLGRDVLWDTLNYHLYNPFAFLTHRYSQDVMVAGIQTFCNPFPDIPFYLLIKYFNDFPRLICFCEGTLGGIIAFFLYKISTLVFSKCKKPWICIICSMLIGLSGTVFVLELGTGMTTIQATMFFMASFWLLSKNIYSDKFEYKQIILAGVLSAIAVFVKAQFAIFVLSVFLSICILNNKVSNPFKTAFLYFIVSLGFLGILSSYWLWFVHSLTGNPIFPMANHIFNSDITLPLSYYDDRYRNISLFQKIYYPFYWLKGEYSFAFDGKICDYRYALTYISIVASIVLYYVPDSKAKIISTLGEDTYKKHLFVIWFAIFSYILWSICFCYLRYFVPIEIMSGIIICFLPVTIFLLLDKQILRDLACVILAFVIISHTLYALDFWRKECGDKYYFFEDLELNDNAVVLLVGAFPSSAITLFQNPKARFIRFVNMPEYSYEHSEKQLAKIKKIINDNPKDIHVIYNDYYSLKTDFNKYKDLFDINDFDCRQMNANIYVVDYYYCKQK